jgi:uncharacterized protein
MNTELKEIRKKIIPMLKEAGVIRSSLFGSVVRGELKKESDIDILVECKKTKGLFHLVKLKHKLEEELERTVDITTYSSLCPYIKKYVKKEEVQIM